MVSPGTWQRDSHLGWELLLASWELSFCFLRMGEGHKKRAIVGEKGTWTLDLGKEELVGVTKMFEGWLSSPDLRWAHFHDPIALRPTSLYSSLDSAQHSRDLSLATESCLLTLFAAEYTYLFIYSLHDPLCIFLKRFHILVNHLIKQGD